LCEITNFDYGDYWAAIEGEDELAVITCGSTTGSICEAIKRLSEEGVDNIKLISICLLLPVQYYQSNRKNLHQHLQVLKKY